MQRNLIIALILAVILVVFALQNAADTAVKLWFWDFHSSLSLLLLVAFGIGTLLGIIFSWPSIKKKNKKISERDKRIAQLSEQVKGLGASKAKMAEEKRDDNPED
ncbi:MAG TPA: LapA family protein [Bacteroidales bacterium]|nr:LapA family protein [Bacteroidales bacterium]